MSTSQVPLLTVSQLTQIIKDTLQESFYGLTIEGEVSGFKIAPTGHWYFSLKDENAVISANLWKNTAIGMDFIPKDGQKVIVTGYLSVYAPRGTYSIVCTSMRLSGQGEILEKLEMRKKYYQNLGYFDQDKKKKIPTRPQRVAVITSPTGAALQDILQITGRRAPFMDIIILPALVQGEEAAKTIAKRIQDVNLYNLADVMIVGRGGGSIEDLLPFSDDIVIQAIYESDVPVISAVGHEIDWALSDFVADLRAPTPSAAAELVCQNQDQQNEKYRNIYSQMVMAITEKISSARLKSAVFSSEGAQIIIRNRLSSLRMTLDSLESDLRYASSDKISTFKAKAEVLANKLEALSPKSVLERGFAIVSTNGKTVRSSSDVEKGSDVNIILNKGRITASVKEVDNG